MISNYTADANHQVPPLIVLHKIREFIARIPFMTFHRVPRRQPATNDERARAQEIVEQYGRTSLARFTLFADKSYFFSPHGSVIAFVRKGRVALALGDPIGMEEDVESSILAFRNFCALNGWRPCFYQVQPDYLKVYKALGFHNMSIGQEAVVDLAVITREGKAGKKFRNAVNRLTRLGHRVEVYQPPLSDELLSELKTVSAEWFTGRMGSEFRFSIGWFDDDYIRHSTVAAVHTPEGQITAFANVVSEYQHNRVTLDLMRHRHKIENLTMDFLFVSLLDWAKKNGYPTLSLGFSPFSGVGEKHHDSFIERNLRLFYENVRFPNLKGLHAFKDKFHPRWESRYMIYPGPIHLPAIAMALARAHYGDEFAWKYKNR